MRTLTEVSKDYSQKLAEFGQAERQIIDLQERIDAIQKVRATHLTHLKSLEVESNKIQAEQQRRAMAARSNRPQLVESKESDGEKAARTEA